MLNHWIAERLFYLKKKQWKLRERDKCIWKGLEIAKQVKQNLQNAGRQHGRRLILWGLPFQLALEASSLVMTLVVHHSLLINSFKLIIKVFYFPTMIHQTQCIRKLLFCYSFRYSSIQSPRCEKHIVKGYFLLLLYFLHLETRPKCGAKNILSKVILWPDQNVKTKNAIASSSWINWINLKRRMWTHICHII